jgi:hypothetical protein
MSASSSAEYPTLPASFPKDSKGKDVFRESIKSKKFNKDMKIPNVKLDNIEVLTGHEN